MDRTQRDGLLLILVAAAGYSCFPIFSKSILDTGQLGALDLLTLRFMLAAPITWLALRMRRGESRQAPQTEQSLPRLQLLGMGVLFALAAAAAFFSLERLPASTYTVIIYSYPAMVALLSVLMGERLSGRAWLALALTVVGIILTVPDFSAGLANLDGVLFTLSNAAFYALYIVLSGRLLRGHRDLAKASAWSITGSFVAMVALLLVRGLALPGDWTVWALILGLAVVSTVIPIFAFYSGMQKLGAPRASILSTVEPVFTLILAALILEERIEPIQMLGAALILTSVILLQVGSLRGGKDKRIEPQRHRGHRERV
jgi:drug/metabolite transporter (DMT)-like permease